MDDGWEHEREPTYGTGYATVGVKCPAFRNHGKREIHCDSAYGRDAVQILRFREVAKKQLHMRIWCCGCYQNCEWYRTIAALNDDS
ncbi:MAG: hypothetical protein IJ210_15155 [Clostridia bacterium]|nr:hypothetical protein [Clostridia bacterium]